MEQYQSDNEDHDSDEFGEHSKKDLAHQMKAKQYEGEEHQEYDDILVLSTTNRSSGVEVFQ